jgi:hypothetical protein
MTSRQPLMQVTQNRRREEEEKKREMGKVGGRDRGRGRSILGGK